LQIERSVLGRAWHLPGCDENVALAISQRHGLADIVGRVLAGRGVGPADAAAFLAPRLKDHLPDPSHLKDLDLAAARLADAVEDGESVGVLGDYDVDGATSTALMTRYLRSLGLEVRIEIPDRMKDGYGPNSGALDRLAEAGCRLVLTLDTGTTAFAPLAHAAGRGQEVLVIDHHAAEERLPAAAAVINPNRLDQASPIKHLAAVGVTFMVLVGVNRELRRRGFFKLRPEPDVRLWLDLVALGTVCDVVPLLGLNRAFVHQGLKVAMRGGNAGLKALASMAGITAVSEAWQLGYALGPRINAGGRIGRSDLGALLLSLDADQEAQGIAMALDELNQRRQAMEREQLALAELQVAPQLDAGEPILIVVDGRFHAGVVGIVASRLVERHHRPALVLAEVDGQLRGSARSVKGFDLGAAVIAARQLGLLVHGGGHAMAAGMTLEVARLEPFHAFLRERWATSPEPVALGPSPLRLEAAVAVGGVTVDLVQQLQQVAPYGPGNAEPVFAVTDPEIVEARLVGESHVAVTLAGATGGRLKGIAFRSRETGLGKALLERGSGLRLAGRLKLDTWQGRTSASLQIDDAAFAGS
jgi:single-stranded-DNA-specific exonuclease